MKKNKGPRSQNMIDPETQRRLDSKAIGDELGWGAWIYTNPTRTQMRVDSTGEMVAYID